MCQAFVPDQSFLTEIESKLHMSFQTFSSYIKSKRETRQINNIFYVTLCIQISIISTYMWYFIFLFTQVFEI